MGLINLIAGLLPNIKSYSDWGGKLSRQERKQLVKRNKELSAPLHIIYQNNTHIGNLLTATIKVLRDDYATEKTSAGYAEINNGQCSSFAWDTLNLVCQITNKYDPQISVVSTEDFVLDQDRESEYEIKWDENLLTSKSISPSNGLTWKQLNSIHFGYHVWLEFGGKYYDAECPEGVENFFELPLFQVYIKTYLEEQNKTGHMNIFDQWNAK